MWSKKSWDNLKLKVEPTSLRSYTTWWITTTIVSQTWIYYEPFKHAIKWSKEQELEYGFKKGHIAAHEAVKHQETEKQHTANQEYIETSLTRRQSRNKCLEVSKAQPQGYQDIM